MEKTDKTDEILTYLRNLAAKFHNLSQRVNCIAENVENLQKVCLSGFRATGTAFSQTKIVCQKIVDECKQTNSDLAEYGGIIEAESFQPPWQAC